MKPIEKIDRAADYIRSRLMGKTPDTGIILGSGLGSYGDTLQNSILIPYSEIPGFVASTAPNHKGVLIIGEKDEHTVILMSGRFHYYEGYSMEEIVFPVRVMARLGVQRLIITNASGAINPNFSAGSLMLTSDHINLSGSNPLIGPNLDELGTRFPDMTDLYSRKLRQTILNEASACGIHLHEGVYVMMSGPSFETPAEIRFLHTIGGDAVGMSSVPEAIAGKHAGMEIVMISALSNMAAGITGKPLSGDDVVDASVQMAEDFAKTVDIALNA